MNPIKFVYLSVIFISHGLFAQSITLRKVAELPGLVQETSGIETSNPLYIWTHTDSGGEPALYKVDTFGVIRKTIVRKNAKNTDWEDIANDWQQYQQICDEFFIHALNRN